jgi:hypothetical protein
MISIKTETILSFGDAARQLPKTRIGRSLHPNTIWRWAYRGLKGPNSTVVKLETTKLGGRNYTSVEALQRFFEQLNGKEVCIPTDAAEDSRKRHTKAEKERARAASEMLRGLGL